MPDPVPTFSEVVTRIRDDYPDFAYIHVLEPQGASRADEKQSGINSTGGNGTVGDAKVSNRFLRDIWGDKPYITNADFGRDNAISAVEREGGLVSFGRHFISNVRKNEFFFFFGLVCPAQAQD